MKVAISKRAARAAERIAAWWAAHADYPAVFPRELLEAIEMLESTRGPGVAVPTTRHPQLKRVVLVKSRCHIYFELDEARDLVRILEVWDGRRGRRPEL